MLASSLFLSVFWFADTDYKHFSELFVEIPFKQAGGGEGEMGSSSFTSIQKSLTFWLFVHSLPLPLSLTQPVKAVCVSNSLFLYSRFKAWD